MVILAVPSVSRSLYQSSRASVSLFHTHPRARATLSISPRRSSTPSLPSPSRYPRRPSFLHACLPRSFAAYHRRRLSLSLSPRRAFSFPLRQFIRPLQSHAGRSLSLSGSARARVCTRAREKRGKRNEDAACVKVRAASSPSSRRLATLPEGSIGSKRAGLRARTQASPCPQSRCGRESEQYKVSLARIRNAASVRTRLGSRTGGKTIQRGSD